MHSGAKRLVSARQAEIADLVASGKSNREIADILFLSPRTVETHIAALFQKLEVRSRTELAAAVLRPLDPRKPAIFETTNSNLPLQLSALVGRESDLVHVVASVQRARLVTLTGAGGVGKTRTAVQVGTDLGDRWIDGVWLVEFAPLGEASLAKAVMLALGIEDSPSRLPLETLISYLKNKSLLLILDNCEHVIAAAASLAEAILKCCAGVRILAASREPLRVEGELAYRLPSLRVPPLEGAGTLGAADALTYGAVALFVERAQQIDRRFAVTDENAPVIAEICRRLDGIPLAIELAAARVKILSVGTLSKKLTDGFRLLGHGHRTALPRHQTMRALIDWSYNLLSPSEQRFFAWLSIFAGGCTLATAVETYARSRASDSSTESTDEPAVVDLLASLVDKSLLGCDTSGTEERYRLLETSRFYAREKLAERGEQQLAAQRHAAAYVALAEHLERSWDTAPDVSWLTQAEIELENWRAALEWAFDDGRGDVIVGQRLAGALQPVWTHIAYADGRRWLRLALDRVNATTPVRVVAQLHFSEAVMSLSSGNLQTALAGAERALAFYRELGDDLRIARSQHAVGLSLLYHGRSAEGEPLLREALASLRSFGRGRYVGFSLARIAYIRSAKRDIASARTDYAEALSIFKALGAERAAAIVASNLAEAEFLAGDPQTALRLAVDALGTYRKLRYTSVVTHALVNVAAYLVALNQYDDARAHAREALELAREQDLAVIVAWALQHLAAVAALQPETLGTRPRKELAARLVGFVDARLGGLNVVREYDHTEKQEYDKILTILRDSLGANELEALFAAGAKMTAEQAIDAGLEV